MKKIIYIETTTDGKTIYYFSSGESSSDVEMIIEGGVESGEYMGCKELQQIMTLPESK